MTPLAPLTDSPAPLSFCQLSSLFGKCQCVQCELGPTRANHARAVPTWGAYGGGGQRLKHSIYKPNLSINTHSNWPINWILMRSVNPNNETHPARWWWIPCWFHKLSDNQFIYVDSKLRIQLKFKGTFNMNPKFIAICKTEKRLAKNSLNYSQILVLMLSKFHTTVKFADKRFAEKFLHFLKWFRTNSFCVLKYFSYSWENTKKLLNFMMKVVLNSLRCIVLFFQY